MSQPRVAKDKVVYITYTIQEQDGSILEQSDLPIGYLHGGKSGLFEKIEKALEGRSAGDTVKVTLTPEEGFGSHLPELTYTDDIENVPEQFRYVGARAEFMNDRGEVKTFVVTRIENGKLTVDGNHPFAGKTVTFTVKVVEVREPTLDELVNGGPMGPPGAVAH